MKSYLDIANGGLLYTLVIIALLYVAFLCVVFYKKTHARALELGVSKETIKNINKSTITLTIVPSLSIVIGLMVLSAAIGIPWAWFRLSVVGSVTYELMAAQMATAALGFSEMTAAASSTATTFGAIMIVMSIGIIAGIVTNVFFGKAIITGTNKMGKGGGGFTPIMNGCFMMAMMCVMLPFQAWNGIVFILVILTGIAIALLSGVVIKATGWKWLSDFTMAFTLIFGMASAILWTKIVPESWILAFEQIKTLFI